jgi:hypothetical protein
MVSAMYRIYTTYEKEYYFDKGVLTLTLTLVLKPNPKGNNTYLMNLILSRRLSL